MRFAYQYYQESTPLPGEIWEVSRILQSPLKLDIECFSAQAQQFIEGQSSPRYVMIVKEPEQLKEDWSLVSIMLLSEQTSFINDVDILIPASTSGFEKDLLALTWLVEPMLTANLSSTVGNRLSREIYDVLLTVGDYFHGLAKNLPTTKEIQSLRLQVKNYQNEQVKKIQAFHQQEQAWTDILKVPLAVYQAYQQKIEFTETIIEEALILERNYFIS